MDILDRAVDSKIWRFVYVSQIVSSPWCKGSMRKLIDEVFGTKSHDDWKGIIPFVQRNVTWHIPIEKKSLWIPPWKTLLQKVGAMGMHVFVSVLLDSLQIWGLMSKNAFHGLGVIKYSKCLLIDTPKELAEGLNNLEEAWLYWEFVSNVLDNYFIFFL